MCWLPQHYFPDLFSPGTETSRLPAHVPAGIRRTHVLPIRKTSPYILKIVPATRKIRELTYNANSQMLIDEEKEVLFMQKNRLKRLASATNEACEERNSI